MITPSYLFSGLDKETLGLAEELQSLGGGDATVSKVELHALIDTKIKPKDCQVLFSYGKSVGIRDVLLPRNHPAKENMKSYPVTSVMTDSTFHKEQLSSDVCAWALQGFNSCLITMGMRDSNCSSILFGDFGTLDSKSMSCSLLEKLFDNLDSDLHQTVGLSVWMVRDQHTIDLLAPRAPSRSGTDFVTVECPEFTTATKVLQEAILRQPGAHSPPTVKESDRGHLFARILLHSASGKGVDSGTLSIIHLVQLLGLVDIDNSKVYSKLSEEDRIATRSRNIELSHVFKVLAEMRAASVAASSGSHKQSMKMTSARNSRLSAVLAPLIQGNAKTFISLSLRDGEGHAAESRNLFTSLQGVTEINTACHRVTGVSLRSLELQQYDSVLGHHNTSSSSATHSSGSSSSGSGGKHPALIPPALQHPSPIVAAVLRSPRSPAGNLSTVSEDYGDVDLQAVLNEDYSTASRSNSNRQKSGRSGSNVPTAASQPASHPQSHTAQNHSAVFEAQHAVTTDLARRAISSEVNKTMDEFHDLMEELQNDSSTRSTSLLLGQKVTVNRFLDEEEQLERSLLMSEQQRSRSYLSTGTSTGRAGGGTGSSHHDISQLSSNIFEASQLVGDTSSRYLSQTSPQRHQSGSYRGMLSEESEETFSREQHQPRSVLRVDGPLNASINQAADEVEGVADAAVLEMIRALRELQRNASQADRSMIESEIQRLVSGSGSLSNNATPIPSYKRGSSSSGGNYDASSNRSTYRSASFKVDSAVRRSADVAKDDVADLDHFTTSYLSRHSEGIDRAVDDFQAAAFAAAEDSTGGYTREGAGRREADADEVLHEEDEDVRDAPQRDSEPVEVENHDEGVEARNSQEAAPHDDEEEEDPSVNSDSLSRDRQSSRLFHQLAKEDHDRRVTPALPPEDHHRPSSAPLFPLPALTTSLELLRGGLGGGATDGSGTSTGGNNSGSADKQQTYSRIFQEKLKAFHNSTSQDRSPVEHTSSASAGPPPLPADLRSASYESVASVLRQRTGSSSVGAHSADARVSFQPESETPFHPHSAAFVSSHDSSEIAHSHPHSSSSANSLTHSGSSLVLDEGIPEKVYSAQHHLEATNEIEKLRRTNQSLMEALREEKDLRIKTEQSLLKARDDVLEVRTQCEVEMDNYRLEIVQLKNQIRSLCEDYSLSDVFNSFEENVARLARENSILRKQNIQLELLELDILENREKFTPHSLDQEEGNKSINGPSDKVRAQTLLKRVSKERDALKEMCEDLRRKERHFDLNAKQAQDAARRLKISHQELNRTKKELEQALLESNTHERDLHLLREETVELKKSEGFLKAERAKMIAEVAQLRERVREMDDERKQHLYLSKFVAKHSQPAREDPYCNNNNSAVPKSVQLTNFGKLVERENQSQIENRRHSQLHLQAQPQREQQHSYSATGSDGRLNIPQVRDKTTPGAYALTLGEGQGLAVSGVAGLSDAQYTRHDERAGGVSDNPDLEVLLNAMHEGIIAHTPSLLPVFRKLNTEIYADRTRSLEQRAKLLERAFPVAAVPLSPNSNNKGKLDTQVPVKSYSKKFGEQAQTAANGSSINSSNNRRQVRF